MGGGGGPPRHRRAVPAFGQKAGQVGPVAGIADQPAHPFQRLFQREDMLAVHHIGAEFVLGADPGIGAHQVQQRGVVADLAVQADAFGQAAGKEIAAQLVTRHQPGRRLAHRLQAFQLKGQMGGQIFGRGPSSPGSGGSSRRDFRKASQAAITR